MNVARSRGEIIKANASTKTLCNYSSLRARHTLLQIIGKWPWTQLNVYRKSLQTRGVNVNIRLSVVNENISLPIFCYKNIVYIVAIEATPPNQ